MSLSSTPHGKLFRALLTPPLLLTGVGTYSCGHA